MSGIVVFIFEILEAQVTTLLCGVDVLFVTEPPSV